MNISVLITYSSLDKRFLEVNVQQCLKFSDDVIIVSFEKLFNGEDDDLSLPVHLAKKYENVSFEVLKLPSRQRHEAYYNHISRAFSSYFAKHSHLLYLDADEIPDDNFKQWLEQDWDPLKIYWFTCYWYFREPRFRAKQREATGLLIPKSECNWDLGIKLERQQLLFVHPIIQGKNSYRHNAVDGQWMHPILKNGDPMIHHFSWVRRREEMITKVKNWSHKNDKSWTELVEMEFSKEFDGTDFIHNYDYDIVENKFGINLQT